jgi:hypothetical protein
VDNWDQHLGAALSLLCRVQCSVRLKGVNRLCNAQQVLQHTLSVSTVCCVTSHRHWRAIKLHT